MTDTQEWSILAAEVAVDRAEEVADWIREQWNEEPIIIEKPKATKVWVEVYFTDDLRSSIAATVLSKQFPEASCALRSCKPRDWQTFWRNHFKSSDIGVGLAIVPIWDLATYEAKPGRHTLILEPGLSFGTGDHFTTHFCLEMLDELLQKEVPANMLDAGTGSGILSIAAAKLGCTTIDAFDFDPIALGYAKQNAATNEVDLINFSVGDITEGWDGGPYELVCANIYSRLLISCADTLMNCCSKHLILTGILEHEADDVAAAFHCRGAREMVRDGNGEWCGMRFRLD